MAFRTHAGALVLTPLEAGWGLASPFVGPEPGAAVDALAEVLASPAARWDVLALSGLREGGQAWGALRRAFGGRAGLARGAATGRRVASLEGGYDGFLGRRSAAFRSSLRRAQRSAERAGLRYQVVSGARPDETEALYARILDVERRSWKGVAGQGIDEGGATAFYGMMIRRLAVRGALRAVFLVEGEREVAYVFGGLFGDTYRGLQVSYDRDRARLAPGNLVQARMIRALAEEGVTRYDLGTVMDYKDRWAEDGLSTATLYVMRRARWVGPTATRPASG